MYDVIKDIERWLGNQETVLIATVVSTWGSSPRIPGAKMAFTTSGKISGSVSGGCVENAVIEEGLGASRSGKTILLHYGVADEDAMEVGLACGGEIDVYVQELSSDLYQSIKGQMDSGESVVLITVIKGPEELFGKQSIFSPMGLILEGLPPGLREDAQSLAHQALETGKPLRKEVSIKGEQVELFADPILPPPMVILIGGAHISVALAALAKDAGFQVVVIDPRRAFGAPERFPDVDKLIQAWPDDAFQQVKITPSTAIVMLTHDPKIDDSALMIALNSPAFYIGALGSLKTQDNRRERLIENGLNPDQIDRIHGPVGLDIGARLPEEIAVSILAEIISVRRGRIK